MIDDTYQANKAFAVEQVKHLWATVSTAANCCLMTLTYGTSYPCWNFPFSLNKFTISQISPFLFKPFHSSDLTFNMSEKEKFSLLLKLGLY